MFGKEAPLEKAEGDEEIIQMDLTKQDKMANKKETSQAKKPSPEEALNLYLGQQAQMAGSLEAEKLRILIDIQMRLVNIEAKLSQR